MECQAIVVHETGGPEVLRLERREVGEPGPGQVRIRHRAIGLNFIDIYFRTGVYKTAMPYTPGGEAAGVIEAVGPGVSELKSGDRVAYAGGPLGSYSEARVMPAAVLVKLPEAVDEATAAGALLKGMTAHYLIFDTYRVRPGDTILVQAAAGGVGLILCQWAKHLGATVIGTVGSDEKAALARAHGCDHTINYAREDFVARVKELSGGAGLPVVYDSVGQSTFMRSLDCLRSCGLMVLYGQSSGVVPPFDPNLLQTKGSLFITRPTLATYNAKREQLVARAGALFDAIAKGIIRVEVKQRFALADAAKAHRALAERGTTGSTVLIP